MPAAIAFAADLVFDAIGVTVFPELIYGAIYTAISIAATIGLSAAAAALSGKKSAPGVASRDVTIKGTIAARQLIYGEARTGGVLVYYGLGGPNGLYLYFVIAVAAHQVDSIGDMWLDSRVIKSAEIDPTTGVVAVTAANGSFWNGGNPELWIFKHLGTSAQAVDADMTATLAEWDATHRGAGIAYVVVKMQHNEPSYPDGAPSSVFSLVRGRRLYDPRLDSTNGGTGSHRFNDATTWTWSRNWALAVRDYLSGGSIYYDVATPNPKLTIGESNARIDDPFVITAANHADEVITVPAPVLSGATLWTSALPTVVGVATQFLYQLAPGNKLFGPDGNWYSILTIQDDTHLTLASGFGGTTTTSGQTTQWNTTASLTSTEARFTADGQLSCGDTHAVNITNLLTGAVGHLTYAKGKYRIYAGVYDTPSVSLGPDDLTGSTEVATHPSGENLYNLVSGTFYDELRGWQASNFPTQQSTAFQTDDGGIFQRNVDLPLTRSSWRAQRLANCLLQQSRNKTTVTLSGAGPAAMNIAEWETFFVNIPEYGWVNQVLRCLTWKFLASGYMEISARVETSAAYTDLALANYQILAGNSFPPITTRLPDAPGALSAQTISGGIVFTIVGPNSISPGSVYELWESASSSPFSSATKVADFLTTVYLYNKLDSTQRYYWVRVRDRYGNVSTTFPATTGVLAMAAMPGFTLANISNTNCFATQAVATGSTSAWSTHVFQSNQAYAGGAFASFSINPATGYAACGISSQPATGYPGAFACWVVESGINSFMYLNGTAVGGAQAPPTVADTFTTFFDGFWVYWLRNGQLVHAEFSPNTATPFALFGDINQPGQQITNLAFGPVTTATPTGFVDIGPARSHDSTAQKISGANAWNSACTSIQGYGACHVQGRSMVLASHIAIGLTSTPKETSGSFTRWDFAMLADGTNWTVQKPGGATGAVVPQSASDVVAVTYDSATARYFLNDTQIDSNATGGLVLFGGASFFEATAGVYMLEFGPGTVPDSNSTFNIDGNAATTVAASQITGPVGIASASRADIGTLTIGPYPVATTVILDLTATWNFTLAASNNSPGIQIGVGSTSSLADIGPNTIMLTINNGFVVGTFANGLIAYEQIYSLPANTTQVLHFNAGDGSATARTNGFSLTNIMIKAEVIKR